MTQIDFYVLPDATSDARWQFACRLSEKAQRSGMNTVLLLDDQAQASALDELLWTFKPESFIPHQCWEPSLPLPAGQSPAQAYLIHRQTAQPEQLINPLASTSLLINLSSQVPPYSSRFARLSELVIQEPSALATSRERFSYYKAQGHPITTHKL